MPAYRRLVPMQLTDCDPEEQRALTLLGERIGAIYLRQRLGLEGERYGGARLSHRLIRAGLTLGGLRKRGRRNVLNIQLRHNIDRPLPKCSLLG